MNDSAEAQNLHSRSGNLQAVQVHDVKARPRLDAMMHRVCAHPAAGGACERVFGDATLRRIVARARVCVRAVSTEAKDVRGKETSNIY